MDILNQGYITAMGSLLSLAFFGCVAFGSVVTSLTELTKDWGIKSAWFYRGTAILFSMLVTLLFAHKMSVNLSLYDKIWLGICTYAGSQGWYDKLKTSDGWFGKFFTSLTDKYFGGMSDAVETETDKQVGDNMKIAQQVTKLTERVEWLGKLAEQVGLIKTNESETEESE